MPTINWSTKVIFVPQSELTFISSGRYGLDINTFRIALKDLEDSEEGIVCPTTHLHNTEVSLSGVTYARIFQIINGYTITFEDVGSPYSILVSGGNHNIADVKNVNQVSLIVGNSAGLISVVSGSGVTAQDKTDIVNMVWDELIANHVVVGSTAASLANAGNGGVNYADIANAVWDSNQSDHIVAGTFGGEIATKMDVKTIVTSNYYNPLGSNLIAGTVVTGSIASLSVRDGTFYQIQESATTGLTLEVTFNIGNTDKAGLINIYGRYAGLPSSTHYMGLWAYNYQAASWEILDDNFMPGGNTLSTLYSHEYFETHVNRANSNEVKLRLIHNPTTYSAAHNLYLDLFQVSAVTLEPSVSATDIADAVWDETIADHLVVGSTGKALSTASSGGVDYETLSGAVWGALLTANVAPGSFGEFLQKKVLTVAKFIGLK